MDIVTLNSKIKLGCNLCDKCCINRGDIRVTPVNVCKISKYIGISIEEFLKTYTNRLFNESLETIIKAQGNKNECMLYNSKTRTCTIHPVKPMQCVMFPLVPENLKKDYFYSNEQCKYLPEKEIKVYEWLNGNNKIYSKNKKICMEWIDFIEDIQPKLLNFSQEYINELYNILYLNYNLNKNNFARQLEKNMNKVRLMIGKKLNNKKAN